MTSCICCLKDDHHSSLVEVGEYSYLQCLDCDSSFLADVDGGKQRDVHSGRRYKLLRLLFESLSYQRGHEQWLVQEMKKQKPEGKMLEVGCGAGFLLKAAELEGYDVLGMDIGDENVRFAEDYLGIEVRNQDFLSAEGAFDWIAMHQLIEHVPNPADFIIQSKLLLKPGGILMITTPNLRFAKAMVKWPRRFFIRPRLGDAFGHPPSHCVIFSPESIEGLLKKHGFKVTIWLNNPSGMKTASRIRRVFEKYVLAKLPWVIGPNMLLCAIVDESSSSES